jgi:hypothetical protein
MYYTEGSVSYVTKYEQYEGLDDWLTVHHSITLVDLQTDAQSSCLFTYNNLLHGGESFLRS